MRQILAIAFITIRNAIRSKIVLSLLLILSAVIILLPFSIRGDGTASGFIQILISYTLGLSTFILALTTLWAGCASISTEISDKTIQMVTTKPVSKLQLWIGKWVGINMMNLILVTICGLMTYGMLQWHLRSDYFQNQRSANEAEQFLSAHKVFRPMMHLDKKAVSQRLTKAKAQPGFPFGLNESELQNEIENQLIRENNIVKPGGKIKWDFGVVSSPQKGSECTLEFKFSPSSIGELDVSGRWLIGTEENPGLIILEDTFVGRRLNAISFPMDERWVNKTCVITYEDIHQTGASFLFDIDATALLVPVSGFTGNYIRSLLIILGKLSFLTALGITAGSLLSLPVATFVSLFFLVLIQFSTYIESIAQTRIVIPGTATAGEQSMTWGMVLLTAIHKALAFVVSPLQSGSPLNDISTGRLVSYAWTFNGLILQGVVYALILGFIASSILHKRELALPSQ